MRNKLLEIKDLEVQYVVEEEIVRAVNGISLVIHDGETLGLVGETGAGKTTTALSIIGLISMPPGRIVQGDILYQGESTLQKTEKQLRKIRGEAITMIFQDPMTSLNPVMTVGEQITEVIRLHQKLSPAQAVQKAQSMLELVGIPGDRYHEYPHQFSGGMKQRVMIAIALACNPKLLIADEPTTALDVTIQAQVLELMRELKREFNTAMLLITHDLGVVAEVCEKVAIMYAGRIVEYGSLEHIFHDPRHPYTKGLFGSIPDLYSQRQRLETIPGLMPDPSALPSGCSFHPRCTQAREDCRQANPATYEVAPGHLVQCLLAAAPQEGGAGI